eukprot:TRINITY_DN2621_c1_g1_i1.p1 TRINITY_DN2621_c1_g1~~TRINITY_DN2621_c1_g1_i1.p1  ORF type:complete len:327 (+),score=51.78 TRINITY_DN2621_c1_g1_i1:86-982(+)
MARQKKSQKGRPIKPELGSAPREQITDPESREKPVVCSVKVQEQILKLREIADATEKLVEREVEQIIQAIDEDFERLKKLIAPENLDKSIEQFLADGGKMEELPKQFSQLEQLIQPLSKQQQQQYKDKQQEDLQTEGPTSSNQQQQQQQSESQLQLLLTQGLISPQSNSNANQDSKKQKLYQVVLTDTVEENQEVFGIGQLQNQECSLLEQPELNNKLQGLDTDENIENKGNSNQKLKLENSLDTSNSRFKNGFKVEVRSTRDSLIGAYDFQPEMTIESFKGIVSKFNQTMELRNQKK